MTKDDQVIELNKTVKTRLSASPIHGIGVFAIINIDKGEKLYLEPNENPKWYTLPPGSLGKLHPEIKEIILERWASVIHGSAFHSPNDDQWLILFINHSDNFNYNRQDDTALKDIKKGEEITSNYREMEDYQKVFTWLK